MLLQSPVSSLILPLNSFLNTPSLLPDASAISDRTPLLLSSVDISSSIDVFLRPETSLAPLNEASEMWVRDLVWSDFRVAVALFVAVPLVLLSWAILERLPNDTNVKDDRSPIAETVLRLMTSYWQASSLLLLTVALNVLESNAGVFAGLFAQAMIFVSLWWWEDLNQELKTKDGELLGQIFLVWRGVASIAALAGVGIQAPFQGCLASNSLVGDPFCAPWLEPPKFAADLVGLAPSETLSIAATSGCALYTIVLAYYVIVLLPSVGRSGRAARPSLMNVATPIGVWRILGFIEPQDEQ